MSDIDDLLDERMTGGGDYPDWWDPAEEGDQIQGIVNDRRDDPWAEAHDDDPKQILEIESEDGEEWSTRTHKVLSNLIKDLDIQTGDYVRIEFTGTTSTNSGHMANDYQMGVVRQDELADTDLPFSDGGVAAAGPPSSGPEIPADAVEFIESLMDFHGDMSVDELERYLNEVRDYDLDPEEVAESMGFEVRNGVVR